MIFATPWILSALVALPLIWWLLKLTPPAPKEMLFPPVRLLFGLIDAQETPAHTPPWLIVLRLTLAGLFIVALADPLLNSEDRAAGEGPLILVVDDGWAAARHWPRRQAAMITALERAGRDDRPVILLTTAPPQDEIVEATARLMSAEDAAALARALAPKPWPVNRTAALAALDGLGLERADSLLR